MKKRVIDYFGKTVSRCSKKIAMTDKDTKLTYEEVDKMAKNLALKLYDQGLRGKPIAIYMKQNVNLPVAMLGVLYTDNFYVVLDWDSPKERINKILRVLKPAAIICDQGIEKPMKKSSSVEIIEFEKNCNPIGQEQEEKLREMEEQVTLQSPAYGLFTSGSTGTPKGVLVTQGNVISYMGWFTQCFNIDQTTEFGAQTPLFFSMSVSDFYGAMFTGGCYHMIPKELFGFPAQLIDYMNEKKINTIYWVPSALGIVVKWDLFKYTQLKYLEKVMFAGEAMPVKYLNYWRLHLPMVKYANLFGPTETTDICAFYQVDREFSEEESLPIGVACDNCQLMVIDLETGEVVEKGQPGELYVKGPFVAKGYYGNPEKTKEAFVQNPVHKDYPDPVYRTGDLVQENEEGQLEYLGRIDFQIKHMGYRIEPGEIETVLNNVDDRVMTVCLYDKDRDQLVVVYESGKDLTEELTELADGKLPVYMRPERYEKVDYLPVNQNGKIDRKAIAQQFL